MAHHGGRGRVRGSLPKYKNPFLLSHGPALSLPTSLAEVCVLADTMAQTERYSLRPEQRLYAAVLESAIRDLGKGSPALRQEAHAWLYKDLPGRVAFADVCHWLRTSPHYVRQLIERRSKRPTRLHDAGLDYRRIDACNEPRSVRAG